jgi:hypothetical protein
MGKAENARPCHAPFGTATVPAWDSPATSCQSTGRVRADSHSGLIFAARITLPHFSVSSAMKFPALRALNFAVPLSLAIESPMTRQIGSVVVSLARPA